MGYDFNSITAHTERRLYMEQVVGVRFKKAGKIYYFAPNNLHLQINDGVIVETSRGMEYGYWSEIGKEKIRLLLFALRRLKSLKCL